MIDTPEFGQPPHQPSLLVGSRQRSVAYDHALLETLVLRALPFCVKISRDLGGPLSRLNHIDCTVVGKRTMARIHREFLAVQGATDVITFPYGEILVCAPVARARAGEFGHDVTTELALYCIHGLLHLAGHDDLDAQKARLMSETQERILRKAKTSRRGAR